MQTAGFSHDVSHFNCEGPQRHQEDGARAAAVDPSVERTRRGVRKLFPGRELSSGEPEAFPL